MPRPRLTEEQKIASRDARNEKQRLAYVAARGDKYRSQQPLAEGETREQRLSKQHNAARVAYRERQKEKRMIDEKVPNEKPATVAQCIEPVRNENPSTASPRVEKKLVIKLLPSEKEIEEAVAIYREDGYPLTKWKITNVEEPRSDIDFMWDELKYTPNTRFYLLLTKNEYVILSDDDGEADIYDKIKDEVKWYDEMVRFFKCRKEFDPIWMGTNSELVYPSSENKKRAYYYLFHTMNSVSIQPSKTRSCLSGSGETDDAQIRSHDPANSASGHRRRGRENARRQRIDCERLPGNKDRDRVAEH